jgi:hypothetical protein
MHGQGTLYQKDGSYYTGSFSSGQMNGLGKQVTVVNGVEAEVFEGSFLRGQRHNEGVDRRVGKSATRLWYNHGRLLRRQVTFSLGLSISPPILTTAFRRCCADCHTTTPSSSQSHHHRDQISLRAVVSGNSSSNKQPNPSHSQPINQIACIHISLDADARFNRRICNRARALSYRLSSHFQNHSSSVR